MSTRAMKGRKTLARANVLEYFAQVPPCLIGIEACGGAHYWARELFPMSTSANTSIAAPASVDSSAFRKGTELRGRILLAALFLLSGLGKVGSYAATAGYMSSVDVPKALLPLVIATERSRPERTLN